MGTSIKKRKRIGKILVLLLASGSLIGISPLTAMAETWTVVVEIEDTTTPPCSPSIVDPIWGPEGTVNYDFANNTADLNPAGIDYRTTVPFNVTLGFQPGSDSNNCDPAEQYLPTGSVNSSWVSSDALELTTLACGMEACTASILYTDNDIAGGVVAGSVTVPGRVGTFEGTLTITWTPVS
jgi:hypothetical protein